MGPLEMRPGWGCGQEREQPKKICLTSFDVNCIHATVRVKWPKKNSQHTFPRSFSSERES